MRSIKVFTLLLAAVLSFGCTKSKKNIGKKVFNAPLSDDVKSLDPALAYDTISLTVVPLAIEALYQYNYLERPYRLEPLLAEALPVVSKDKLNYTIKIKKGVFFHKHPSLPGKRELKAQDFIYAWKRLSLASITSPGTWIFDGKVKGYAQFKKSILAEKDPATALKKTVSGLKAVDDYTIEIQLTRPYPQLLHVLAMSFAAPVAHEVVEKQGHDYLVTNMVGTGPYVLKSFIQGSKVVLEKNPEYRKELYPKIPSSRKEAYLKDFAGRSLPFADEIHLHIYKESQPQWLSFLSGKLDVSGVPKDNFDQAILNYTDLSGDLKKKGVQLFAYTPALMFWLEYNMKDPVVGQKKFLREAISHAINFEQFNKKFLNGRGELSPSLLTPGIEGYAKNDDRLIKFNLDKAKEILKNAGHPEGEGLPTLTYDVRGSGTTSRQMAEFIKVSLDKVGIKIKIVANSFPGFLEKSRNGTLQFSIGGWQADYPDPENFLLLLSKDSLPPGPNSGQYSNAKYEELYSKIAVMDPSPVREELIREAENVVYGDHPRSMAYHLKSYSLHYKKVKGYFPSGLINNTYKYVDIEE